MKSSCGGGLAMASGIETPMREGSAAVRSEAQEADIEPRVVESRRRGRADREDERRADAPGARGKHGVDLDTGAIVAVMLQAADQGDTPRWMKRYARQAPLPLHPIPENADLQQPEPDYSNRTRGGESRLLACGGMKVLAAFLLCAALGDRYVLEKRVTRF